MSARSSQKVVCNEDAALRMQPPLQVRERLIDAFTRPLSLASIAAIIFVEIVISSCIVRFVPYTEIDWEAYMQQVDTFQAGELDYINIKGGTGPLVYPAGFLYFFSAIKALIGGGSNVSAAQHVFIVIYALNSLVILLIYRQAKLPALSALPLLMSKRVHSIFVLRLFNDCVASLFAHLAVLALTHCKLKTAATLLSLGVSIKMNVSISFRQRIPRCSRSLLIVPHL
jgi:alpha-1,3-mannosyltransferase